jgi:PAS domain S-box-containing protein
MKEIRKNITEDILETINDIPFYGIMVLMPERNDKGEIYAFTILYQNGYSSYQRENIETKMVVYDTDKYKNELYDTLIKIAETGFPYHDEISEGFWKAGHWYEVWICRQQLNLVVSFIDITDKKRNESIYLDRQQHLKKEKEEIARRNEEMLKTLLVQLPAAIAILKGPKHIFEMANDLYSNLVGKTDLIGLPGREAVPEIVAQGIWDIIDNVYNTGESFTASEFPVFRDFEKNSTVAHRYFNFSINPLYNSDKKVEGIIIHAVDITDLVDTRNIIQDSGEQFRVLANNIPQVVWKADTNGNIVFFNKYWYDYSGLSHRNSLEWEWLFNIYSEDTANIQKLWTSSIKSGNIFETELRIRNFEGYYRWFSARASAMKDNTGKVIMWIGVFSDIQDQKESAEALENAVKERTSALSEAINDLSRSNNDLEQFAYVASHDMKEPIRMVSSYAMLFNRKYKSKIDSEADEYIGYITEGAKRMQELIEDLLDYSRIGRSDAIKPGIVDFNKVLQIAKANLHDLIENTGAVIKSTELPAVHGKAPQLVRLLQNLIGNSIKFTCKDTNPEISIDCSRIGNQYHFTIRDNGIGIDPAYAEKIFVIFQRLHTREKYSGTGIGLAVCKKIVELHGGKIWVESELDKGSTFHFTLNR